MKLLLCAIFVIIIKSFVQLTQSLQPVINGSDIFFQENDLKARLFRQSNYNPLIQPVKKLGNIMTVNFHLAIVSLINLDDRRQTFKANVWYRLQWFDPNFKWSPEAYDGQDVIRVSPKLVWKPDIVLLNNADGQYEVSFDCNILIHNTGEVIWVPPSTFTTSCIMNVQYFPFDEQICEVRLTSWTYTINEIRLDWFEGMDYVDLSSFMRSASWEILEAPGEIINITRADGTVTNLIIYRLRLRRKPLFYVVNLIMPIVLTSLLTICVFYLPVDAGAKKVILTISILLAMVVFLLLMSKILPPTDQIPLINKFLLATFLINLISCVLTVFILNLGLRSPNTHNLPDWLRIVFIHYLPPILFMRRPGHESKDIHLKGHLCANNRLTNRLRRAKESILTKCFPLNLLGRREEVNNVNANRWNNDSPVSFMPHHVSSSDINSLDCSTNIEEVPWSCHPPPDETGDINESIHKAYSLSGKSEADMRNIHNIISAINFIEGHSRSLDNYSRICYPMRALA